MRNSKVALILLVCLFLTACSSVVDAESVSGVPGNAISLSAEPIGQTFVARHGGLHAIEVWFSPEQAVTSGDVILELKASPSSPAVIRRVTLPASALTAPQFYRLAFPVIANSHSTTYFAEIRSAGVREAIAVSTGPADTYRDGALYLNTVPVEAQLSFRLVYNPVYLLFDLVKGVPQAVVWVWCAILLYVVPGLAVLITFWPGRSFTYGAAIGLAVGISFALYPLFFLVTSLAGLSLGAFYAWLPAAAGLAVLLWHHRHVRITACRDAVRQLVKSTDFQSNLLYTLMILLLCVSRFLPIRGLTIPLWGDSVQHAAITQLFIDHNGFFETWLPYAPYTGLSIHFGFHTLSAVFAWISHLGAPEATLVAGQFVNVGAILALYPLAEKLSSGKRGSGFVAVLTAGFISRLPAFYVNWGRYPQLAGLTILPVAIWLVCDLLENARSKPVQFVATGAVIAGMTLSYYRMPYFLAVYMLVWLIFWGISHDKENWRSFLKVIIRLTGIAFLSGILLSPWLHTMMGGTLMEAVGHGATGPNLTKLQLVMDDYQVWQDITQYVTPGLILLFGVGLVASLVRKAWLVTSLALWTMGMASLVATRLVGLPGANLITNFGVMISLYIPVSLMVGWLAVEVSNWITRHIPCHRWIDALLLLGVALWGTGHQLSMIDPMYIMVTQPDLEAMAWIRENVPLEAKFLVEGFRNATGRTAVGSDAGWWLPILTQRRNTMPPQYAMLNEQPIDPLYTQNVVNLIATLESHAPSTPDALQALCANHVTHVYIGQQQGEVGIGITGLYTPGDFTQSPAFSLVYHQDRVWIFEVDASLCSGN